MQVTTDKLSEWLWADVVIMAEDVAVSEEILTDGLTLLVNMGKVLLQNAKEEAAGRADSSRKPC